VPKVLGTRKTNSSATAGCSCSTCKAYPWNGSNLKVADDFRNLGQPASPTCQATTVQYLAPFDNCVFSLEGVSEGYILLEDGTVVLRKFQARMKSSGPVFDHKGKLVRNEVAEPSCIPSAKE